MFDSWLWNPIREYKIIILEPCALNAEFNKKTPMKERIVGKSRPKDKVTLRITLVYIYIYIIVFRLCILNEKKRRFAIETLYQA